MTIIESSLVGCRHAIAHNYAVLDCLVEIKAPFNPDRAPADMTFSARDAMVMAGHALWDCRGIRQFEGRNYYAAEEAEAAGWRNAFK